jgi:hypothetical protein
MQEAAPRILLATAFGAPMVVLLGPCGARTRLARRDEARPPADMTEGPPSGDEPHSRPTLAGATVVLEKEVDMDINVTNGAYQSEEELRAAAVKRLKDKQGLTAHLLAYVMVNLLLAAVWAATSSGFFWPVFPLFGWGIGLVFHAWGVYSRPATPARIAAEMNRLRRFEGSGTR